MMADSDTQSLIENGEELLGGQPPERQHQRSRPGLRAGAVLAALGCAAGAAVLLARRGGASGGDWDGAALREGMTQLALAPPPACSAYTDCAALPGNCCPTDAGNALGCCNSPRLDTAAAALGAGPAELGPAPEPVPGACEDTWGWTNGYSQCNSKGYNAAHGCMPTGLSCRAYALFGWCADGAVAPGKEWTKGEALNFPETNCCACGKAPNPPADDAGAPAAPAAPALAPVPAPPAVLPGGVTQAPATDHAPTLGPPQVPAAAGAASAPPPPPTSAPLAGGAAPNGTQGEPVGADCALNSGCAKLGMAGACCPTADGVMLGCCSTLESSGPPVLPAAKGPGPLMTFYMYRVANDEDYPLNGVNMANLAGDMWYLHNEVVQHCPRKFNMERLLRFKVTARATAELHGQRGRNFDAFVAFDQAKCTVPMCEERHWAPFGYVVGCQPNNVGQVAVPGSPTWYSLPGTCPNKFYYEKTAECSAAEPGGACPTSEVTGTKNCTYYLERAGEIRLDDLSGLKDYNKVCRSSGVLEFDEGTDLGVGTKFWNGKTDAAAGSQRMQTVKAMFAQKYPTMPADLDDPTCDVPQ